MVNIRLLACMAAFFLVGCAGKSYVVLLDDPDGSTGKLVVKGSHGEQTIDRAGQGALLDGSEPPAMVDEKQIARDFYAAMAARPMPPQRFLLYFETSGVAPSTGCETSGATERFCASTAFVGRIEGFFRRNFGKGAFCKPLI